MNGLEHVNHAFAQAKGRACFMPYFPIGYPDYESSLDIIEGLAKSGADLIEIGIPFSDPIADGPTVQEATQIALQNKTNLPKCLEAVKELRQRGVDIPFMLMGYVNPMLAYGLEAFIKDATEVGASGFIVPDLPPDEASEFLALVDQYQTAYCAMVAPTSNAERIKLACSVTKGFIYLVSVTGVTGARQNIPLDLEDFIKRVRAHTNQPIAVGFGIGTPEKAQAVGKIADGVIIGSKVVTLAKEGKSAVFEFAQAVTAALEQG